MSCSAIGAMYGDQALRASKATYGSYVTGTYCAARNGIIRT